MPYFAIAKDRSGVYVMNDDNTPLLFYTPSTRNGQSPFGQFTDILDSYLAGDDTKADQVNLTLGNANAFFAEQQGRQSAGQRPAGQGDQQVGLMPQGQAYAAMLRPNTLALQWAVMARRNEAEKLNHLADLRELEMKYPELARSVYVVGEGSPDGNSGKVSGQNKITGQMLGTWERGQEPGHLYQGPGADAITERMQATAAAYDESDARQRHQKEAAQRGATKPLGAPPPITSFKHGGKVERMASGGSFGTWQQPQAGAQPAAQPAAAPAPQQQPAQMASAPTNPAAPRQSSAPPAAPAQPAPSGPGGTMSGTLNSDQLQNASIEGQQRLQAATQQFQQQQAAIEAEVQQRLQAIAAEREMAMQQIEAERQRFAQAVQGSRMQKMTQLAQQGEALTAQFRRSGLLTAQNPFAAWVPQQAA